MHIDFALPVNHDLVAGLREWKKKAQVACADYGFHMAVTSWSAKVAADMETMVKEGINSFKFFMAYKVRICAELHCAALHCTALHCTALHCTALHCTVMYSDVLHCTWIVMYCP
jgi:dihydroorotase-like cyclic amidohydrolase